MNMKKVDLGVSWQCVLSPHARIAFTRLGKMSDTLSVVNQKELPGVKRVNPVAKIAVKTKKDVEEEGVGGVGEVVERRVYLAH